MNAASDLGEEEVLPWADDLYRQRSANFGYDDPNTIGCLPRGSRQISFLGQIAKVIQTRSMIVVLFEDLTYRQIFLDGRELPIDANPSFMGYSVGRWNGDTLVIDSNGFNDRTWLDFGGHPHTKALRLTERWRRTSVGPPSKPPPRTSPSRSRLR